MAELQEVDIERSAYLNMDDALVTSPVNLDQEDEEVEEDDEVEVDEVPVEPTPYCEALQWLEKLRLVPTMDQQLLDKVDNNLMSFCTSKKVQSDIRSFFIVLRLALLVHHH